MSRLADLILAEDIVRTHGSHWMFQKSYTDARQFYDIRTSVEMALEQQDLLGLFEARSAEAVAETQHPEI